MKDRSSFSSKLRWWRTHRGLSQLALAGSAEISQRHLSFLEVGRSTPSRDMVLRLANVLNIPLREQNAMLLTAGYAPAWQHSDLSALENSEVTNALNYMLMQQEPYPAVVVDRNWNLFKSNRGSERLVEFLVGPLVPGTAINLADALVAPDILKPYLANWAQVVRYFLHSVSFDASVDGTAGSATLLNRLLSYPGVRDVMRTIEAKPIEGPVLPMHFHKGGVSLKLFTAITTLGTPQDVTLQEIRIESFFPMDAQTANWFKS